MASFWFQHQCSIVYFLGVLLLIALSNLWAWQRLGVHPMPRSFPHLAVLVPVRNEEGKIESCVRSLLAQDYPDFEVVLLDDQSSDGSAAILRELAQQSERIRVISGEPLPAGWVGKHWACHQLARSVQSDFLLFVDADTRYQPQALRLAMAACLAEKADLLSVFPRQEVGSWAEKLMVPVMHWSIFSFMPLVLAYRLPIPALSVSNGQFMLFRREAYEAIGGHAAVQHIVVDDIALTRRVRAHGLRWRLLDGDEYVHCRMYHNFREVYEGFSKSLFAFFDYRVALFLFIWLWLLVAFWEPLVVLALGLMGVVSAASMSVAGLAVLLSLLLWGLTHWHFGFPLYLALCYPFSVLLAVAIAQNSLYLTLSGRATWKGRRLGR
ncbi:MAG: glycosyltransferase [Anaerolineae bacterium]